MFYRGTYSILFLTGISFKYGFSFTFVSFDFQVAGSKIFERDGPNVHSTATISFTQVKNTCIYSRKEYICVVFLRVRA